VAFVVLLKSRPLRMGAGAVVSHSWHWERGRQGSGEWERQRRDAGDAGRGHTV